MADRTPPQDRLQPALLDRLTDEAPHHKQETIEARVISRRRLRESVLRDLSWLLNATQLEASQDLSSAPHVRASVLNFGLPALSGKGVSSLDVMDLTRGIREAILHFEPRILPATLRVQALHEPGDLEHHNVIGVQIQGQLWAQPLPMEFLVRTDFDLESGTVQINDLLAARVE